MENVFLNLSGVFFYAWVTSEAKMPLRWLALFSVAQWHSHICECVPRIPLMNFPNASKQHDSINNGGQISGQFSSCGFFRFVEIVTRSTWDSVFEHICQASRTTQRCENTVIFKYSKNLAEINFGRISPALDSSLFELGRSRNSQLQSDAISSVFNSKRVNCRTVVGIFNLHTNMYNSYSE